MLPFLLRLPILLSLSLLRWLALGVLAAGHLLWWSLFLCLGFFFLSRRCCVFFLSSFWGCRRLLLSLLCCVCSACPRTPAVFPLRVMQLVALLGFHSWLTQVGCPTPAVMILHGVGVGLVQMSCYPPCLSSL